MDTLDKGTIHIPRGIEWNGVRFPHATQNTTQYKMNELFICGTFHLISMDLGTETTESKTVDKEALVH